MTSNFLSEQITDIINNAIDANTFPDGANEHLSHLSAFTPKHLYTN